MKYIKTPTGEVFEYDKCIIFDEDLSDSKSFFDAENQTVLAQELFEQAGILVADVKGGENIE